MSFHLGGDYQLVPNGLALRFGGSMEYAASPQPDAALFAGPRYGLGAGLSFADRGYAIDVGYIHFFTDEVEVSNGNLGVVNMAHRQAEADVEELTVQNNGVYTSSHGYFGIGIRADLTVFAKHRKQQRKAWYQVWSKGATGFGRGGF
jgi:long-subunit fatty acid transport protein